MRNSKSLETARSSSPSLKSTSRSYLADGLLICFAIAFAKLVFHCVFNNRYGYFRDEFDYL